MDIITLALFPSESVEELAGRFGGDVVIGVYTKITLHTHRGSGSPGSIDSDWMMM